MAANPRIPLGTLNRVRGNFVVPDFPSLNVSASYLGPAGISMAFNGTMTGRLPAMTGEVTSPEVYQGVTVTINLLKTQVLAAQYEAQKALTTLIGDVQIVSDASTFPTQAVYNCSINTIATLSFAGTDAGYNVEIGGYILINNNLFNMV